MVRSPGNVRVQLRCGEALTEVRCQGGWTAGHCRANLALEKWKIMICRRASWKIRDFPVVKFDKIMCIYQRAREDLGRMCFAAVFRGPIAVFWPSDLNMCPSLPQRGARDLEVAMVSAQWIPGFQLFKCSCFQSPGAMAMLALFKPRSSNRRFVKWNMDENGWTCPIHRWFTS